ncbi:MAG: glutamate 5-kinase [Candidatus Binatia bacterium]|nr:MAG: glutamate 5-kinase [Candidatus Binatia bacterium]
MNGNHLAEKARLLSKVRRVVVKIGSGPLSGPDGVDRERIRALAEEIAELGSRGVQVVLVTSGAVATGARKLGLGGRPRTIPERQAAAAVGQIDLMALYEECFERLGKHVGQVLLTHDDLANRKRYINARHTLDTLLAAGVVPIANENDTVAIEELNFGDNDNLSALVATLVEADLLVLLSDVPAVYTTDPRTDPSAKPVPLLRFDGQDPPVRATRGGPLGTGGMEAKLGAARKAAAAGIPTVIADGRDPRILARVFDPGVETGTLVLPSGDRLARRKHWIAYTLRPAGSLRVDEGAYRALLRGGRSLLPGGIVQVEGRFQAGDCVRCLAPDGRVFAQGLVNYDAAEIEKIKGRRTADIEAILGYKIRDEVIHRDDLVLLLGER